MIGCSFLLLGIAGKGLVNPRPRLKCNDWEVSSDVFKAHETCSVFSKRDFEYAILASQVFLCDDFGTPHVFST